MVIAERNAQKQVRVNWNYMAGPNITFLKPVYLQIIQPQGDSQGRFSVERYDPDIHNNQQQNFYGTAAFTNGLNETTVEYGLQARSSLSAYWGDKDDHFYGLEVGGQLLAYPEKLEIMANDNNRALFLNLFVGIKMGWQS